MGRRVAICAVAQIENEPDIWYLRFQGMVWKCIREILEQTGVTFDMETGIRNIVTCSDDVLISSPVRMMSSTPGRSPTTP